MDDHSDISFADNLMQKKGHVITFAKTLEKLLLSETA